MRSAELQRSTAAGARGLVSSFRFIRPEQRMQCNAPPINLLLLHLLANAATAAATAAAAASLLLLLSQLQPLLRLLRRRPPQQLHSIALAPAKQHH